MPLRRLLPFLSCPLCAVHKGGSASPPLLRNPFTLRCGHTVCSSHLQTPDHTQPCPLPVCSSTQKPDSARPNIPASSRVIYLPAPPLPSSHSATATSTDKFEQRVDITVSKLIDVVSRHSPPLVTSADLGDSDHSDGDDQDLHHAAATKLPSSDEELDLHVSGEVNTSVRRRRRREPPELDSQPNAMDHLESALSSTSIPGVVSADTSQGALPFPSGYSSSFTSRTTGGGTSDSGLSPEPPKKRLRRDSRALVTDRQTQSCAIEPEAETGISDSRPAAQPSRPFPESLPNPGASDGDTRSRVDKELLMELSCEICFAIYYQPVTTPCQHTFCGRCLQRSLDHKSHCPVCRADLPDYVFLHEIPQNKVVLAIEYEAFPDLYAERERIIEEEERNARLDTPLFVCQLSFPGVPTNLHFFEPKYRLMLRRCLESPTPRFGMIMPPKQASTNVMDFGTMLEIRTVRMLPDGRSLVHTWGVSRFRVLERGTLDGYTVGRVEDIEDFPEELEDVLDSALEEKAALEAENQTMAASSERTRAVSRVSSPSRTPQMSPATPPFEGPGSPHLPTPHIDRRLLETSNEVLMNKCRTFVEQLRDGAAPWIVQKLNDSYGNMPTDASDFSFWVALVLPIDEYEKAKLLPIRSARLRLKLVAHWIDQLNSNWWFSNGCVVC